MISNHPPTMAGSQDSKMATNQLPTEVIQHLYGFLPIHDILSLSRTSKRFHMAYIGHQLPILHRAVQRSYSPICDLVKLVCANEPDTRPRAKLLSSRNRAAAHVSRVIRIPENPKLTVDMISKMVSYGEVAQKWVEIYPRLKWRDDSDNRRLLRPHEQERLRKAIYNFWTYNSIFHHSPFHPSVVEDPSPLNQNRPWSEDPRLRLLRIHSTLDLVRIAEFYGTMHQLIEVDLCPSNATIIERYARPLSSKAIENMGWGEDYSHQKLILVLMKLRPRELLHLFEKTSTKSERMNYILSEGGTLIDTPSTMRVAIGIVARGRTFNWHVDEYGRDINWGITDSPGNAPDYYDICNGSRDANPDGAWPFNLELTDDEQSDVEE